MKPHQMIQIRPHLPSIVYETSMLHMCAACCLPIQDQFLYQVLEKDWHQSCVVCSDCKKPLNDKCFSRDGMLFCKDDFARRFGTLCAGCRQLIGKNELVRRAQDRVFHINCFVCSVCQRCLDTGEELYIVNGTKFICKKDYQSSHRSNIPQICSPHSDCGSEELLEEDDSVLNFDESLKSGLDSPLSGLTELPSAATLSQSNAGRAESLEGSSPDSDKNVSGSKGDENSGSGGGSGTKRRGKGPRTTIKAKQLETLKAAFAATPKPTRHIREQLAQETGLNMRVIQVWFQNRRSKERRMKQLRNFGPYRPGRNRRGLVRDDSLPPGHLFPGDALGRPAEYFAGTMGFYCDMYNGGGDGHPGNGLGEMPLPPPHRFLMPPDEPMDQQMQPQEEHYIVERHLEMSPDLPMPTVPDASTRTPYTSSIY